MSDAQAGRAPLAQRIAALRATLDAHRGRLVAPSSTHDSPAFIAAMEELLDLVRTYDDTQAYAALEHDGSIARYHDCFAQCMLRFTWVMEERTYAQILDSKPAPKLGTRLGENTWGAYARMGETLKLFHHSTCRRILMVGCGPVPDTLFYLHDWTDAPELVGVDNDAAALRKARDLIAAFGLDRIRIEDGDAREVDYAGYDVVCCSAFLTPRAPIMQRLADTASPGTIVILRDPVFTGTLIFESVVRSLPERLEVRAQSADTRTRFMLKYYILDVRPVSG